MDTIDEITRKSTVIPLGFDFQEMDLASRQAAASHDAPVILWNHRWEYDKNPQEFFEALRILKKKGVAFRLIVCGESYQSSPPDFEKAQKEFAAELIHFGFAPSRKDYLNLLYQSDIVPVTSHQDFFGISVVEAAWAGAVPLLPQRLAYPEVFPLRKFPELYYDSGGLLPALEKALGEARLNKSVTERLRKHLFRYEWSKIYPKYFSWLSQNRQ